MTDNKSNIEDVTSGLKGASPAELLTNLREKIHQTRLLEKSNVEIEQMLQSGKADEHESSDLDQDDKVVLKEAFEENKEAIQRKKQASQIFCDMLMRKTEEDQVSKELALEIQTTIREVQESSTAAIENQGIFM